MPIHTWHHLQGYMRKLLRKRRKKERAIPTRGIPDGISYETINECCRTYLNEPLREISYIHLSGWKKSGAYQLFLETQKGRQWSLVYKNAYYSPKNIPALKRLSVIPGPPEYLIYKYSDKVLAQYLPQVFLASEIISGKHYQYLLEDLSKDFFMVRSGSEILAAARKLPEIHASMQGWVSHTKRDQLICYDRQFSLFLREYAQQILKRYVNVTSSETGKAVCQLWRQISEICAPFEEMETLSILTPIHGDFNISNVHISKNGSDEIKLVDWEWAGLGLTFMDLASLLKRVTPEVEEQALDIYSEHDSSLSPAEQKRLYYWCQLERGILDAAFIATQLLDSPITPMFSLEKFVEQSLRQVLIAYRKLAA